MNVCVCTPGMLASWRFAACLEQACRPVFASRQSIKLLCVRLRCVVVAFCRQPAVFCNTGAEL